MKKRFVLDNVELVPLTNKYNKGSQVAIYIDGYPESMIFIDGLYDDTFLYQTLRGGEKVKDVTITFEYDDGE